MARINSIKEANQYAGRWGVLMDAGHPEYEEICQRENLEGDPYIVVDRSVQPSKLLATYNSLDMALKEYQRIADSE